MKRYNVKWGAWDCFSVEVPAMNVAQAIEVVCTKHKITADQINSITNLGNW